MNDNLSTTGFQLSSSLGLNGLEKGFSLSNPHSIAGLDLSNSYTTSAIAPEFELPSKLSTPRVDSAKSELVTPLSKVNSGSQDDLLGVETKAAPLVGDLTETTTVAIAATATGSQTPPTATRPNQVINGDFEISSNNERAPIVGDGLDERTWWTVDFTEDPEILAFQRAELITAATLTLELKPLLGVDGDTTGIEGLRYIDSPEIKSLPLLEVNTITIDLLETYSSNEILGALKQGEFGKFRMYYDDDAIVSFAKIELAGKVPVDLAGNTPTEARKTLPSTEGKTYQGRVGNLDPVDYYSLHLGMKNDFNLTLDGLSANANVQVLDFNSNVIYSSANPDKTAETISGSLESGIYFVRVEPVGNIDTPYDLNLSIKPALEGLTTTGSEAIGYAALDESGRLINIDKFPRPPKYKPKERRFEGLDGRGQTTVVIDSGIDSDHPFFGVDLNKDGIADRILYQEDFVNSDFTAEDDTGHGTHVASIIASEDPDLPGIAPKSNIIPLKVLNNNNEIEAWGDVEQALQWVLGTEPGDEISRIEKYNITSVNLSLGDGRNWQEPMSRYGFSDELKKIIERGVVVIAASGNGFAEFGSTPGEVYPAADPHTISVGAVWDTRDNDGENFGYDIRGGTNWTTEPDHVAAFSQRHPNLTDVFAPGAYVRGATLDGGVTAEPTDGNTAGSASGTSFAAPHVSGMVAIAQQLSVEHLGRRLAPNEFRALLVASAATIFDGDEKPDDKPDNTLDRADENDDVNNTDSYYRRADMQSLAYWILSMRSAADIRSLVGLTIYRVREIDEMDASPGTGADFYARMDIDKNGWVRTNTIGEQNDVRPTQPQWQYRRVVDSSTIPIDIQIFEDDRAFKGGDDHVDINPAPDVQDLVLIYDRSTGHVFDRNNPTQIWDVGEVIHLNGDGDSKRGEIWFRVDDPGVTLDALDTLQSESLPEIDPDDGLVPLASIPL